MAATSGVDFFQFNADDAVVSVSDFSAVDDETPSSAALSSDPTPRPTVQQKTKTDSTDQTKKAKEAETRRLRTLSRASLRAKLRKKEVAVTETLKKTIRKLFDEAKEAFSTSSRMKALFENSTLKESLDDDTEYSDIEGYADMWSTLLIEVKKNLIPTYQTFIMKLCTLLIDGIEDEQLKAQIESVVSEAIETTPIYVDQLYESNVYGNITDTIEKLLTVLKIDSRVEMKDVSFEALKNLLVPMGNFMSGQDAKVEVALGTLKYNAYDLVTRGLQLQSPLDVIRAIRYISDILFKKYNSTSQNDARFPVLKKIYTFFAQEMMEDSDNWLKEIDLVTKDYYREVYERIEAILFMIGKGTSLRQINMAKELLDTFDSQLSPELRQTLRTEVLSSNKDNVLSGVLLDVKEELIKNEQVLRTLREDKQKAEEQLEKYEEIERKRRILLFDFKKIADLLIVRTTAKEKRDDILQKLNSIATAPTGRRGLAALDIIILLTPSLAAVDRIRSKLASIARMPVKTQQDYNSILQKLDEFYLNLKKHVGSRNSTLIDSVESIVSAVKDKDDTSISITLFNYMSFIFDMQVTAENVTSVLSDDTQPFLELKDDADTNTIEDDEPDNDTEALIQALKQFDSEQENAESATAVVELMQKIALNLSKVSKDAVDRYNTVTEESKQTQLELDSISAQLQTLESQKLKLEEKLRTVNQRSATVSNEIIRASDDKNAADEEYVQALGTGRTEEIERRSVEASKRKVNAENELKVVRSRLGILNSQLSNLTARIDDLKNDISAVTLRRSNTIASEQLASANINQALKALNLPQIGLDTTQSEITIQWFTRVKQLVSAFYINEYLPMKNERDDLLRINLQLKNAIEEEKVKIASLTKTKNELEASNVELTKFNDELRSGIERLYSKLQLKSRQESDSIVEKLNAIEAAFGSSTAQSSKNKGIAAVVSLATSTNIERTQVAARIETVQEEISRLNAEVELLRGTNTAYQDLIKNLESNLAEERSNNQKLAMNVTSLREEVDELKNTIARLLADIKVKERELFDYQSKRAQLKELQANSFSTNPLKNDALKLLEERKKVFEAAVSIYKRQNRELYTAEYDKYSKQYRALKAESARLVTEQSRLGKQRKTADSAAREVDIAEQLQVVNDELKQVEPLYLIFQQNSTASAVAMLADLNNEIDRIKTETDNLDEEVIEATRQTDREIEFTENALQELKDDLQFTYSQDSERRKQLSEQLRLLDIAQENIRRKETSFSDLKDLQQETLIKYNRVLSLNESYERTISSLMEKQQRLLNTQVSIAAKLNMSDDDFFNLMQLLGTINENNLPTGTTLQKLAQYLNEVPAVVDVNVVPASSSLVDDDDILSASSNVKMTMAQSAQIAVEFDKNKSALIARPQIRYMSAMAATEAPVFKRYVPAARVEITNTFDPAPQDPLATLLRIDDSFDIFTAYMNVITEDSDVPADHIDRFYMFANLVQGRVASSRPFWLPKHEGMKALVAHAIEAATKTTQTRIPVSDIAQRFDIYSRIMKFYDEKTSPKLKGGSLQNFGIYDNELLSVLAAVYPSTRFGFSSPQEESVAVGNSRSDFIGKMSGIAMNRLYVEQDGLTTTRPSQLAVVQHIKKLFERKLQDELGTRRDMYKDMNAGQRIFTVLISMVDKTFFAAFQTAMQAARIPLDFNNEDFLNALGDSNMADYVAVFYNQAFARSRHTVTAKRTTLFDTQASFVREALSKYKPPSSSLSVKREVARQIPVSSEEPSREINSSDFYDDVDDFPLFLN